MTTSPDIDLEKLDQIQKHADHVADLIVNKGLYLCDILNHSEEDLEAFYQAGYELYKQGYYEKAYKIFRYLNLISPSQYKFTFALAASMHKLNKFLEASYTYFVASTLDPNNPMPHFHSADCFIKLKDKSSAIDSLMFAIEKSGDKKEFAKIKERSIMMQEKLSKSKEK